MSTESADPEFPTPPALDPRLLAEPELSARWHEIQVRVEAHPAWDELPEAAVPWAEEDRTSCPCHHPCTYAGGRNGLADAAIWSEGCRVLLKLWPWPLHIDFMLHEIGEAEYAATWQILGPDARAIEAILEEWVEVSKALDFDDPDVGIKVAEQMPRTPAAIAHGLAAAFNARPRPKLAPHLREGSPHRKLHRLAERDGGWVCTYCKVGLIDVCSDDDMAFDAKGRRYLNPKSEKRMPTRDHIVPQSLGGSHGLPNLVLACQPCNSRKSDS